MQAENAVSYLKLVFHKPEQLFPPLHQENNAALQGKKKCLPGGFHDKRLAEYVVSHRINAPDSRILVE